MAEETIKLLLNQQREFMEEQKRFHEEDLNQQKEERANDMKKLESLISNVKDDVKSQLEKLEGKQSEALAVVKKDVVTVTARQDEADGERLGMLMRIENLETQMEKVQNNPTQQVFHTDGNPNTEHSSNDRKLIMDLVSKNRRTIGLAPIDKDDVRRQGRMHETENEDEMLLFAYKEFMKYELKMQQDTIENLKVVKIFREDREDFDRLYVEFEDESSTQICYRHTPKMRKDEGVRLITYISPEFIERNRALVDYAYPLRYPEGGKEKLKTRIVYGDEDLILEARRLDERRFRKVHVDNLPKIDLKRTSFPPPVSKSPAEGRNRTTKRPHSPPSLSDNPRGTKTAKANEGSERVNSTSPSLRKKLQDRGSFSLTNARSPALTLNNKHNEFHFSPVKSTLKPKTNVQ
jgi:hypothetical protein